MILFSRFSSVCLKSTTHWRLLRVDPSFSAIKRFARKVRTQPCRLNFWCRWVPEKSFWIVCVFIKSNFCYKYTSFYKQVRQLFSSSFNRSILGFLRVFSFAILSSSDNNSDGKRIRLANMANSKVADTKPPKATVPP